MLKKQPHLYSLIYSIGSQERPSSILWRVYLAMALSLSLSSLAYTQQQKPIDIPPPQQASDTQKKAADGQPAAFVTGVSRSGYMLGPGDQFKLTVFDYDEFTGPQVVLPDGSISLPIVGSIQAADRTPEELSQEVTQRLRPYLKNPIVTVALSKLRPLRINVSGELQRPGPIQLGSATSSTNTNTAAKAATIGTALAEAGGVNRDADIRKVVLKRYSPDNRQAEEMTINLWEAIWSEKGNHDVTLKDGDSLFIPKLGPEDTLDRRLIARSSLAPKTVKVRVVGEVKKPGEVEIQPNGSISGAVAVAGGPTDKADLGQVAFTRLGTDGRIETKSIDLNKLADNDQIQDGDVVIVPKSSSSGLIDTFSQVISPIYGLVNLFRR